MEAARGTRSRGYNPSMMTAQHNSEGETLAWAEAVPLTPQERSLLRLAAGGCAPEQAARTLGVTAAEAHGTLEELQARCGALGRRALITRAVLEGWVERGHR